MTVRLSLLLALLALPLGLPAAEPDAAFFQALGYRVRDTRDSPSDWHAKRFGTLARTLISIKSTHQVKGEPDTYYRFVVHVETYPDPAHASQRLERLLEPSPDEKADKAFPLRKGFASGRTVYIVTTDVYLFQLDGELERILDALRQHVATEPAAPAPGGGVDAR